MPWMERWGEVTKVGADHDGVGEEWENCDSMWPFTMEVGVSWRRGERREEGGRAEVPSRTLKPTLFQSSRKRAYVSVCG